MSDRDPYSPQNFYEMSRRTRREISLDVRQKVHTEIAIAEMKANDALEKSLHPSPTPTPTLPRVHEELVRGVTDV